MGKFDGILICTDLDGTLLRSDKSISDENLEAIERFKAGGGYYHHLQRGVRDSEYNFGYRKRENKNLSEV